MITPITHAYQLEMDMEVDRARLERLDWQRAIERNLHAVRDYVHPDSLIVYQPGDRRRGSGDAGYRAFDVQVTSESSCTCPQWRLQGRCLHVAFARRLEATGHTIDTDTPIAAASLDTMEIAS